MKKISEEVDQFILNEAQMIEVENTSEQIAEMIKKGEIVPEKGQDDVNNHIHTTYSFSPYSPTAAVYAARTSLRSALPRMPPRTVLNFSSMPRS